MADDNRKKTHKRQKTISNEDFFPSVGYPSGSYVAPRESLSSYVPDTAVKTYANDPFQINDAPSSSSKNPVQSHGSLEQLVLDQGTGTDVNFYYQHPPFQEQLRDVDLTHHFSEASSPFQGFPTQFTYRLNNPSNLAPYNYDFPKPQSSYLQPANTDLKSSTTNRHRRGKSSISTNLGLVSLDDHKMPQLNRGQTMPEPPGPPQAGENINVWLNKLLPNLAYVDASNINNFLLQVTVKVARPVTLDHLYNILYNEAPFDSSSSRVEKKNIIDKTIIGPDSSACAEALHKVINFFESPSSLSRHIPNLVIGENKLNVNFHELLRTFLAIKILCDILVVISSDSDLNPQENTIPRLSIYKTYYIICHKLITTYPSISNTASEQQKLVLGQSKIGKLIKLAYPSLLIKRLGSRGESKYNYLGVRWNENIVTSEIQALTEGNDLDALAELFQSKRSESNHSRRKLSEPPGPPASFHEPDVLRKEPLDEKVTTSQRDGQSPLIKPRLSFLDPFLKFPRIDLEFTSNNEWLMTAKRKLYSNLQAILDPLLITEVVLGSQKAGNNSDSMLSSFVNLVISPNLELILTVPNVALNVYLIFILELVPLCLFAETSDNLGTLRLNSNLEYFISNYEIELRKLKSIEFESDRASTFVLCLQKLSELCKSGSMLSTNLSPDFGERLSIHQSKSTENLPLNGKFDLTQDILFPLLGYEFEIYGGDETLSQRFDSEILSLKTFFCEYLPLILSSIKVVPHDGLEDTGLPTNLTSPGVHHLIEAVQVYLLTDAVRHKIPIFVLRQIVGFLLSSFLKQIIYDQESAESSEHGRYDYLTWYSIDSFIQNYLSLMGEIIGLEASLS